MNARVALIKQLVDSGTYPIDDVAIAEAIVVRARARNLVPGLAFRIASAKPPVRSFRRHSGARSFRLHRPERRPADLHVVPAVPLARAA